jgi:hypothetical protein
LPKCANREDAACADGLDAIGLELVVAALAVGVDELRDRVPPLEYAWVRLDAERRERVKVRAPLLNLFVVGTHRKLYG